MVVYTSDQGFFLGEHGWFDKRFIYEESLQMPFLIRYPAGFGPGETKAIATNVDFAPTFLDYAGLTVPSYMQGRSLRRSEEHTSELQSLMRTSYAVFCLKKKQTHKHQHTN